VFFFFEGGGGGKETTLESRHTTDMAYPDRFKKPAKFQNKLI